LEGIRNFSAEQTASIASGTQIEAEIFRVMSEAAIDGSASFARVARGIAASVRCRRDGTSFARPPRDSCRVPRAAV